MFRISDCTYYFRNITNCSRFWYLPFASICQHRSVHLWMIPSLLMTRRLLIFSSSQCISIRSISNKSNPALINDSCFCCISLILKAFVYPISDIKSKRTNTFVQPATTKYFFQVLFLQSDQKYHIRSLHRDQSYF